MAGCSLTRFGLAPVALSLAWLAVPASLTAQEDELAALCAVATVSSPDATRRFCNLVAQGVEVVQPRIGLAAAGGNPVLGTASTLGMRIGKFPRISIGGRVTAVQADLPPIRTIGSVDDIDFAVGALAVDGAIGVFQGFSPAITVGGVLSLDLLASAGLLLLPDDDGFDDSPFTWGAGLRLGIFRESFTLPGISVSAMYRRVGEIEFGDPALQRTDAAFSADDYTNLSFRGVIGKRLFGIGLAAGAGYDHYSTDVAWAFVDPADPGGAPVRVAMDGFDNDRFMLFLNAGITVLILTASLEVGWQQGGDVVPAALPAVDFDPEDGAFFGSFAIRIAY